MAKYWEDWSGSTVGSFPSGWSAVTDASDLSALVQTTADSDAPAGRVLEMQNSGAGFRATIKLDAVDSDSDRNKFKIAALCTFPFSASDNGAKVGPAGRIGGSTGGNLTAYASVFRQETTNVSSRGNDLVRYNSGFTSINRSGNTGIDNPAKNWLVLECDGDQITRSLRSVADPTTVIASSTVTDSTLAGPGGLGLFCGQWFAVAGVFAVAIATGDDAIFFSDPSIVPIEFDGTVPTQNLTENVAMTPLDLSTYFDGSETPFAYTVQSGTLQTGLSLNGSTGVISGTPTEVATRSIVVRGTDDAADTADTNSFDIVVAEAPTAVKGIRIRLYDGATEQASITGISVLIWDGTDPDATAADYHTATAVTDSSGWLEIDLDALGALDLDDLVYVLVWKRDTTDVLDSLGWQGVLPVIDIA
jgi:hypothetical protein